MRKITLFVLALACLMQIATGEKVKKTALEIGPLEQLDPTYGIEFVYYQRNRAPPAADAVPTEGSGYSARQPSYPRYDQGSSSSDMSQYGSSEPNYKARRSYRGPSTRVSSYQPQYRVDQSYSYGYSTPQVSSSCRKPFSPVPSYRPQYRDDQSYGNTYSAPYGSPSYSGPPKPVPSYQPQYRVDQSYSYGYSAPQVSSSCSRRFNPVPSYRPQYRVDQSYGQSYSAPHVSPSYSRPPNPVSPQYVDDESNDDQRAKDSSGYSSKRSNRASSYRLKSNQYEESDSVPKAKYASSYSGRRSHRASKYRLKYRDGQSYSSSKAWSRLASSYEDDDDDLSYYEPTTYATARGSSYSGRSKRVSSYRPQYRDDQSYGQSYGAPQGNPIYSFQSSPVPSYQPQYRVDQSYSYNAPQGSPSYSVQSSPVPSYQPQYRVDQSYSYNAPQGSPSYSVQSSPVPSYQPQFGGHAQSYSGLSTFPTAMYDARNTPQQWSPVIQENLGAQRNGHANWQPIPMSQAWNGDMPGSPEPARSYVRNEPPSYPNVPVSSGPAPVPSFGWGQSRPNDDAASRGGYGFQNPMPGQPGQQMQPYPLKPTESANQMQQYGAPPSPSMPYQRDGPIQQYHTSSVGPTANDRPDAYSADPGSTVPSMQQYSFSQPEPSNAKPAPQNVPKENPSNAFASTGPAPATFEASKPATIPRPSRTQQHVVKPKIAHALHYQAPSFRLPIVHHVVYPASLISLELKGASN